MTLRCLFVDFDSFFASSTAQQLFLRLSPAQLYNDIQVAVLNPSVSTVLGPGNLGQAISSREALPTLLSLDQSILVVWPQIVLLVAAEMIGAEYGIGAYVLMAGALFATDQLIAGVAILSALGLIIGWLIGRAERYFLSWRT